MMLRRILQFIDRWQVLPALLANNSGYLCRAPSDLSGYLALTHSALSVPLADRDDVVIGQWCESRIIRNSSRDVPPRDANNGIANRDHVAAIAIGKHLVGRDIRLVHLSRLNHNRFGQSRRRQPAIHRIVLILTGCPDVQVAWIYTRRIIAMVTRVRAIGELMSREDQRKAMNSDLLAAMLGHDGHRAISAVHCSEPWPACIRTSGPIDSGPKPRLDLRFRVSVEAVQRAKRRTRTKVHVGCVLASTVRANECSGILGAHLESLLTGIRGAIPRTVPAVPGSLRCSNYTRFPRTYAGLGGAA